MKPNRFKFRVWDKREKKMYLPDDGQTMRDEDSWFVDSITAVNKALSNDEYIWMQSTGRLDKNGKEIFEGDILKFEDMVGEVYWWKEKGGWYIRAQSKYGGEGSANIWQYKSVQEILGNKFTNPELLN